MAANLKILFYAFQLASLTSYESKILLNYQPIKTRLVRLISTLTKEFINFYLGPISEKGPYTVANWDQSFIRDGVGWRIFIFLNIISSCTVLTTP